jgi:hypothetical protein
MYKTGLTTYTILLPASRREKGKGRRRSGALDSQGGQRRGEGFFSPEMMFV